MSILNRSLVRKLLVYFSLLNIVAIAIVGSYSYFRARKALVERTFDQLTSVRIEKKYRIEKLFTDRTFDLRLVTNTRDVHDIIDILGKNNKTVREDSITIYKEYDRFLQKHFLSGRYYRKFYLISDGGRAVCFNIDIDKESSSSGLINMADSLPVFSIWKKILSEKEPRIEDYRTDRENDVPAIFIGAPVRNESGSLVGAAIVEIDINAINSIMFEVNPHNGLGRTGESYLVGNDLLMRSTSRFQDNSVFKTIVNTAGVLKALEGNTGTSVIKDYRGIRVLSSYSRVDIPGLDWVILAEIDEEEAMIPIYSIRNNILFLGVLLTLLLFAVVYLIARKISQPVSKLEEAARKITKGDYDVMVKDISSHDEIGSLVAAFNEMSLKIKEQRENLMLERSMRLSSMIDGQELERLRLSRELHDGLAQSILAIKLRLERAEGASPGRGEKIMEEVKEQFNRIIEEIRSISHDLMPAELDQFGLGDALSNLCREVSNSSGIDIQFSRSGFHAVPGDRVNTYLYRITQEALNNIIKHSKANTASVILESDDHLRLEISDNGRGFNYHPGGRLCGNGISNIKERVSLLNGVVDIISTQGNGTKIKISIPLNS